MPVIGLKSRNGRVVAKVIKNTDKAALQDAGRQHVEVNSIVLTDEACGYVGLHSVHYEHYSVRHSAGEYYRDGVHTNTIESVRAVLKRSIIGTWHQVSSKHLDRYVSEVTFRLNNANVKDHTLTRLDRFISATDGKRLTYERLIA